MKTVIFACVQNAGRSQMASAFFNALCAPHLVKATSAGTTPGERIDPGVLEAMREASFDLSGQKPRPLTPELASGAYLLVTMGCGESCPTGLGVRREDWPILDPHGQSPEVIRKIRDEVRKRVWKLLAKEGWYRLQPVSLPRFHAHPVLAT